MRVPSVPNATLQIIRDEHAALAAVLRSLSMMIERGADAQPGRFFDVLRAMLFYIDEFPERLHHPKESDHLFPKLARAAPELLPVIHQLEADHMNGEASVRELQHKLLAWELIGETRRQVFADSVQDWSELDAVFETSRDPLAGGTRDPAYDGLFTRIVLQAPAPIGVGAV